MILVLAVVAVVILYATIAFALIPEGGVINMTMSAPDPVPTTTINYNNPEPCNDLIQIICEQTLIC